MADNLPDRLYPLIEDFPNEDLTPGNKLMARVLFPMAQTGVWLH